MLSLITDREQNNVDRLKELSRKGWQNMTASEKAEWSGNPMTAKDFGYNSAVNLFPNGPFYSWGVSVVYRSDSMIATALYDGVYMYAVSIIGDAADYEGKTLTLSMEKPSVINGATPQLALYWHDDGGYEYAGASLSAEGTLTFTLTENAQNRAFLAMYVYVTTDTPILAGAKVKYNAVMLEEGSVKHAHVPYTAILPTPATKGGYNYSDLNRVESVVSEISDLYGLSLITKTDWNQWDKPNLYDMERYLSNIKVIRTLCPDSDDLPETPRSMQGFTYEMANNIEKILAAAYESADGSYRSGELYSGEV